MAVVVPVGALVLDQGLDRVQALVQVTDQARFIAQAQMQVQDQAQVQAQDQVDATDLAMARAMKELARLMAQVTDPGSLPVRIRDLPVKPCIHSELQKGPIRPLFYCQ